MNRDPITDLHLECMKCLGDHQEVSLAEFSVPPRREFGDLACNLAFKLARTLGKPPHVIASDIVEGFNPEDYTLVRSVEVGGAGFINFRINREGFGMRVINAIQEADEQYGEPDYPPKKMVLVEHTAVNPNKPWHIGHARNAILGDTVGRVLRKAGYDVEIHNWINDAGRQIGETIYALKHYSAPTEVDEKFDHYLAQYYVRLNEVLSQKEMLQEQLVLAETSDDRDKHGELNEKLREIEQIEEGVEDTLRGLEKGEYRAIIERCVDAQLQTAWRLGVFYDLLTWETDIVRAKLLEEAMVRIQQSPHVYIPQDGHHKGCLIIEMGELLGRTTEDYTEDHTDKVVLVRSNGLPSYVGKDIAFQMWKFGLLNRDMKYKLHCVQPNGTNLETTSPEGAERERKTPTKVVNVIGAEQSYAQQVVYAALKIIGFEKEYAGSFHLDYGLVGLEEGRMSGRQGVWISADEVIGAVVDEAHIQLKERRGDDLDEDEAMRIAEAIAIGAIRFEMCRYDPTTFLTFRIGDMLDLKGYSSLYLQYAHVRAKMILKKARARNLLPTQWEHTNLYFEKEEEWVLTYTLAQFPSTVNRAGEMLNPGLLTSYGYELATVFNQFYEKCPVIQASGELLNTRLALVDSTSKVLRNVLNVLGIPLVDRI